jgi:hypothetical protein
MCLLSPETIGRESGLALVTPGAHTEARAMYGGLEFALGLYFGVSAFRTAQLRPALVVLVFVFAGLALARLAGLALQPEADPYNIRALAYESVSALLGLVSLTLVHRAQATAPEQPGSSVTR